MHSIPLVAQQKCQFTWQGGKSSVTPLEAGVVPFNLLPPNVWHLLTPFPSSQRSRRSTDLHILWHLVISSSPTLAPRDQFVMQGLLDRSDAWSLQTKIGLSLGQTYDQGQPSNVINNVLFPLRILLDFFDEEDEVTMDHQVDDIQCWMEYGVTRAHPPHFPSPSHTMIPPRVYWSQPRPEQLRVATLISVFVQTTRQIEITSARILRLMAIVRDMSSRLDVVDRGKFWEEVNTRMDDQASVVDNGEIHGAGGESSGHVQTVGSPRSGEIEDRPFVYSSREADLAEGHASSPESVERGRNTFSRAMPLEHYVEEDAQLFELQLDGGGSSIGDLEEVNTHAKQRVGTGTSDDDGASHNASIKTFVVGRGQETGRGIHVDVAETDCTRISATELDLRGQYRCSGCIRLDVQICEIARNCSNKPPSCRGCKSRKQHCDWLHRPNQVSADLQSVGWLCRAMEEMGRRIQIDESDITAMRRRRRAGARAAPLSAVVRGDGDKVKTILKLNQLISV